MRYTCSAIVNDRYCEDTVEAVSDRQAWFKFAQKYGYRMRNFTVMGKTPVAVQASIEQLKFNI